MKVCIIGVGNIGMRYVQGITATFPDAHLFLIDSPGRLIELGAMNLTNATLCESLGDLQTCVDLIVVSTSCEPRFSLYNECLSRQPRFIILEKYLFNGSEEFEQSLHLAKVPTFVNQWMYGSQAFDCLFETDVSAVEVRGTDWGLACNAVHWIDVMKRHLDISHLELGQGTVVDSIFPSKRNGYEEVYGEFVFVDRDSYRGFKLIDRPELECAGRMEIVVDAKVYDFDYTQILDCGKSISKFPYFSSQIGAIVSSLMNDGTCHLPSLEESVSQHMLIEDILGTLDRRPVVT